MGKRLTVKADPDGARLEIFDGADGVATHQVVAKGKRAINEAHVQALRQARWDRVHARRASSLVPAVPLAPTPTLVGWPHVPVVHRSLQDYATLIEEVQTCRN